MVLSYSNRFRHPAKTGILLSRKLVSYDFLIVVEGTDSVTFFITFRDEVMYKKYERPVARRNYVRKIQTSLKGELLVGGSIDDH